MLWYGYIYYFLFLIILFISLIFFFRLLFLTIFNQFNLVSILSKNILSFFVFFSFISFLSIYNFLDFFTSFNAVISTEPLIISNVDFLPQNYIWNTYNLNLNLLSIYYFPFIYIFIVITVISILFCLSYNLNELMGFMFYVTLILIAGLTLFYTDSIILFFFAYEMLLVPSFLFCIILRKHGDV